MLRVHAMIPSYESAGTPHDNASCESFMKTLKRSRRTRELILRKQILKLKRLLANKTR